MELYKAENSEIDIVEIKKAVKTYFDNIRLYKKGSDLEDMKQLLLACEKHQLVLETSLMYRAMAMNYFYRNIISETIANYKKAIELAENVDKSYYILFIVELADLCYRESIMSEAEHLYCLAEQLLDIDKLPQSTLFKYFYWRGIMLNNTAQHVKARNLFKEACNYAGNSSEKAAATMNIALSFHKAKMYEEAIEQYKYVLDCYDEMDLRGRGVAYNNIADLYLEQKRLMEAQVNSIKALAFVEIINDANLNFVFTQTFVQIRLKLGDLAAYESFARLLEDTIYEQVDKRKIIGGITGITEVLTNREILKSFFAAVKMLLVSTTNSEYKKELQSCTLKIQEKILALEKEV